MCKVYVNVLVFFLNAFLRRRCPRGVMVKAMNCGIVVSEFVLQSCSYVHFRANILGNGMSPPYPPSYWLNNTTTVLYVNGFGIK